MPYPGIPSNLTAKMEKCVAGLMKSGKSKSSSIAICHSQIVKEEEVRENVRFNFMPEFEVLESGESKEEGKYCLDWFICFKKDKGGK